MRYALAIWVCVTAAGCGGGVSTSLEELMDPEACKQCHPVQFQQWSGSMHAYAADDPVFLAMNKRGQRETNGELGDFCVGCHAPMAVRLGLTTDGLNLEDIPQKYKGVTCYFCHNIKSVEGLHNNQITLAMDKTMRGSFSDGVKNGFHQQKYSEFVDGSKLASADACGSCHDVVTPAGVHLERSYKEWSESVFNAELSEGGQSCSLCHMMTERGPVADFEGVPSRRLNDHSFPGVDVAVTDWPEKEAQLAGIERDLFNAVVPRLCVNPDGGGVSVDYILENAFAGHSVPSGAAHDRRGWAEILAYDGSDQIVFASGNVMEGQPVVELEETDPFLWQIRDFGTDDNGEEVHFFWEVRNVISNLLPAPVELLTPHAVTKTYATIVGAQRITVRMRLRPMGLEIIDDLIASGDLAAEIREQFPTFNLTGTELEWNASDGFGCFCPNGPC